MTGNTNTTLVLRVLMLQVLTPFMYKITQLGDRYKTANPGTMYSVQVVYSGTVDPLPAVR